MLSRPLPSLLHCTIEVLDILSAINICPFSVPPSTSSCPSTPRSQSAGKYPGQPAPQLMAATPNATGRDVSGHRGGRGSAQHPTGKARRSPAKQQHVVPGNWQPLGNEVALAKDEGTGHPCCLVPSLSPSVVLASNTMGRRTEQGVWTYSMTCGNFNPFSFAHRETGWHRPLALQPPGSKTHHRSCSAVISFPRTVLPQQKPQSMQINHSTAHEQQLCPIPSRSSAAGTLQPVYPDFKQQLQLLQHHSQQKQQHAGGERARGAVEMPGQGSGCSLDAAEPEERERPSGKVAVPGPREGAPGGGIPLPAPGMALCLQQACKCFSCQLS